MSSTSPGEMRYSAWTGLTAREGLMAVTLQPPLGADEQAVMLKSMSMINMVLIVPSLSLK
ncbi:MAG: hypothetical protein A4E57_04751 [Syntrophorhabdaceae bacterium PtaU1.Bin034]|nr:MAG: hypothetical protein A4E57_04751 [Syntrophorhabdaceae bacterium PtaU1.Bin034]